MVTVSFMKGAALAGLLLATPIRGSPPDSDACNSLGVSLGGYYHYGSADGFLQTPAGGEPGSSSPRRPTLEELGVQDAGFYNLVALVRWRQLGVYAEHEAIVLNGHAVLSGSLVSRNVTFPAGTPVRSETELASTGVGLGRRFELADGRLQFFPKAELAVLDFRYALSGGGQAGDRSYAKGSVRLGAEGRYRLTHRISLAVNAGGSVPISNTPQIMTLTGTIEFDLLPRSRWAHPTLVLGCGVQRIEYEDNQRLPNHFRIDLGPFVTAGLGIGF